MPGHGKTLEHTISLQIKSVQDQRVSRGQADNLKTRRAIILALHSPSACSKVLKNFCFLMILLLLLESFPETDLQMTVGED